MSEQNESSDSSMTQEKQELFVFGYECKVFRDDEKAEWIENGKHLIPWMGDSSLLIDRYDGRGALMDLKSHESVPGVAAVASEDAAIERKCDLERYRDLREDQEFAETAAYQEEEFRRLQLAVSGIAADSVGQHGTSAGYAAVGYSYKDNNVVDSTKIGPEPKKVKENNPFVKPPGLFPPPDVILPKTMKSHAIIEKTAKFIAGQDGQMEIILKTKQAANPQFEFLNFSHPLNAYYKFLVTAIQTCAYQPAEEFPISPEDSPTRAGESASDDESSESSDSYLHPSLAQNNSSVSMSSLISSSIYKPSTTHSAYSMLVSKIKEVSTVSQPSPPLSPYPALDQSPNEVLAGGAQRLMPSSQDQVIIDKMANYVVKNGPAFETLAGHKGDTRFMFLDPTHPSHWYYLTCKERYQVEAGAVIASRKFVGYAKNSPSTAAQPSSGTSTPTPEGMTTKSGEDQIIIHLSDPTKTTTLSSLMSLKFPKAQAPSMPAPNHANAMNRMASLPPELISKIEELRRKTMLTRLRNAANGGVVTSSVSPSPDTNDLVTSTSSSHSPPKKPKREQLIKFSSSLSQRQRTLARGSDSPNSDIELLEAMESSHNAAHNGNGAQQERISPQLVRAAESEEVKRLQEERRKRAAIFLQKLKLTKTVAELPRDEPPEKALDEKENVFAEQNRDSDVESIPSPKRSEMPETQIPKEQNFPDCTSSTSHEPPTIRQSDLRKGKGDLGGTLEKCTESIIELGDSPLESSQEADEPRRSKLRKLAGKTSLVPKPAASDSDDDSETDQCSSSSHSARRKKAKRKHSKKRKKKHEKSRSHSSKKSKREKYE